MEEGEEEEAENAKGVKGEDDEQVAEKMAVDGIAAEIEEKMEKLKLCKWRNAKKRKKMNEELQ